MILYEKAILFDMDGVTINTEPLYTKAELRLFAEYGVKIPKEDWSLFRGSSEESFFKLSMDRYKIAENKEVFMNKGRQYVHEEFIKEIPFMNGFKNVISLLRPHYRLGLVTASPIRSLYWINKKIDLDSYFDEILSGEQTKRNKPFPDPY